MVDKILNIELQTVVSTEADELCFGTQIGYLYGAINRLIRSHLNIKVFSDV